ncbi:MAG: hypothetical protein H6Q72_2205 [Firmicutes bacterium]|nr:hypothetical protein [Bacillota bacterium]
MNYIHIFSGNAQLAEGSDIHETYKYITVVAKIDVRNGEVVDCDVPVFCEGSSAFIAEILIGKNIAEDLDEVIDEIETRMHSLSKWALITAIQTMHNRYIMYKRNCLKSSNCS